ncbi:hypothetical protein PVT67_13295 [Gallaecimonas kandeliae]|uniref:hypothetical protein n=1 Tax=Gallaecimonas kandeliae TaxID=3029055 RepID=UPI002647CD0D|nr:hypothetical protein [Gallaecimonas kandeliae]WKE64637.1 hypothetical protein PVT67_13295 [Gallaecimonas kandeliae]
MTYLLSDIFGDTAALRRLAAELGTEVIAPYEGRQGSEDDAYRHFLAQGGIDGYLELARRQLPGEPCRLVGFSAGAAVAWLLAAEGRASEALCFYGGQIRHHPQLRPACEVSFVWPVAEDHFSVPELVAKLQGPGLHHHQTQGRHGFMNPLSKGHEPELARHWQGWLRERT